jgi:hypothetical protein
MASSSNWGNLGPYKGGIVQRLVEQYENKTQESQGQGKLNGTKVSSPPGPEIPTTEARPTSEANPTSAKTPSASINVPEEAVATAEKAQTAAAPILNPEKTATLVETSVPDENALIAKFENKLSELKQIENEKLALEEKLGQINESLKKNPDDFDLLFEKNIVESDIMTLDAEFEMIKQEADSLSQQLLEIDKQDSSQVSAAVDTLDDLIAQAQQNPVEERPRTQTLSREAKIIPNQREALRRETVSLKAAIEGMGDNQKLRLSKDGKSFEVVNRERGATFQSGKSEQSKQAVAKMLETVEKEINSDTPLSNRKKQSLRDTLEQFQSTSWGQAVLKNNPELEAKFAAVLYHPNLSTVDDKTTPLQAAASQIKLAQQMGGKLKVVDGKIIATPREGGLKARTGTSAKSKEAMQVLQELVSSARADNKGYSSRAINTIANYVGGPNQDPWAAAVFSNHPDLQTVFAKAISEASLNNSITNQRELKKELSDQLSKVQEGLQNLKNEKDPAKYQARYNELKSDYGKIYDDPQKAKALRIGSRSLDAQVQNIEELFETSEISNLSQLYAQQFVEVRNLLKESKGSDKKLVYDGKNFSLSEYPTKEQQVAALQQCTAMLNHMLLTKDSPEVAKAINEALQENSWGLKQIGETELVNLNNDLSSHFESLLKQETSLRADLKREFAKNQFEKPLETGERLMGIYERQQKNLQTLFDRFKEEGTVIPDTDIRRPDRIMTPEGVKIEWGTHADGINSMKEIIDSYQAYANSDYDGAKLPKKGGANTINNFKTLIKEVSDLAAKEMKGTPNEQEAATRLANLKKMFRASEGMGAKSLDFQMIEENIQWFAENLPKKS